jgi:GxxExxY protein
MSGKAKDGLIYENLTHSIIGAAMEVHRELKPGFTEKIYENALTIEFDLRKIPFKAQNKIQVIYKGKIVGDHILDIIVDGKVIVELKAVEQINNVHEAQLIGYLKASKCRIGLLINFSKESLEWKRILLKDNF